MAIDPVSAVLNIGSKVIDKLWPDPNKAAEAKLELLKMQQSGELAQIAAQLEVNKIEAQHNSVFVAGWRPSIGWVCSCALAYQYLLRPIISTLFIIMGHPMPEMPALDANLWELVFGMLGLGTLRTFEKMKGIAS